MAILSMLERLLNFQKKTTVLRGFTGNLTAPLQQRKNLENGNGNYYTARNT